MKKEFYRLLALETGYFALDGGAMFGVVPKTLWQKAFPADEANRIQLALRTLLLISPEKKILIDTGIGSKFDQKWQSIYKINHTKNTLQKNLRLAGLKPEHISDVILTHLHFDHCGGTTCFSDNKLHLTFPNATYHIQREQWDWANSPSEKDRASFQADDFKLLLEQSKLNLIDGPAKIFPGVQCLSMHGHTPGMQIIKISLPQNTIIFCSDLIPTAAHIPLPWVMAYDNNPMITIEEKRNLLPLALDNKWILFFEHDPFRAAGTISLTERGYMLKDEISTEEFNQIFG
jgi:glyoxylase-like metal-dependent hydrolase (beta-lactamase superfamily II)